jgi:K+-transporting ATPase ATPase A chain
MEGKEVRFGPAASAYWAITTTVTSNGSVNSMHDSLTPLSGMFTMLGMEINSLYGGVGVGFLNFFIFIIIAVFIAGLMVGRTPEFLGKKVEAKEMKLRHHFLFIHFYLVSQRSLLYHSSSSRSSLAQQSRLPWIFEILYEYTSSSASNGSGFSLGDNTQWWNITCGL